jgi:ribosomal protein S2
MKNMDRIPDIVIIIEAEEINAVKECKKLLEVLQF